MNNKRFHFVDNAGQSRFADLTAANRAEISQIVVNGTNNTRTIFIRHQPSTSRNVVTIYKRIQAPVTARDVNTNNRPDDQLGPSGVGQAEGDKAAEENSGREQKKAGPSSFPYSCSVCSNRFRNAFALLKHLNKTHYHRTVVDNAKIRKNNRRKTHPGTNNSTLRQLRSLAAPSGRILFTLLKTSVNNPVQNQPGENSGETLPKARNVVDFEENVQVSYKCRFCPDGVRFAFRSQLYLHYKYHRRLAMAQRDRKLVCGVCQRIFVNRSSLFVHIRCRHPVVTGLSLDLETSFPAVCSLCFKRFRNETDLETHLTTSHFENRSFPCEECSPQRKFRSSIELALHKASHKKEKRVRCSICDRRISTKSNLARHLILIHGTDEQKAQLAKRAEILKQAIICLPADEQQPGPPSTVEDRVQFVDDFLLANPCKAGVKCQICCRLFKTIDALIEHRRLRHSDGTDQPWQYLCQKCGQRFQFPSQLAHHLKTGKGHNKNSTAQLPRIVGQQQYPPKRVQFSAFTATEKNVDVVAVDLSANTDAEIQLARERQLVRENAANIVSNDPVPTEARPPSNLASSSAEVGNDEEWMIPLLSVGRLLEESSSQIDGVVAAARADISSASVMDLDFPPILAESPEEDRGTNNKATATCVQQGNGSYSCSACSKVFSRFADANRHVRVVHAEQRPFACEVCKKTFKWRHSYVDHRRTHSGERPYVCEHCQASFTASGNLVRHKKHSHPAPQSAADVDDNHSGSSNSSSNNITTNNNANNDSNNSG